MNREDIIRMAREAGGVFIDPPCGDCYTFDIDNGELERFFQAAYAAGAAAEREACAKVCEDEDVAPTDDAVGVQQCIAAAIRARGQV